jgi:hypothetical protein
MTISKKKLIVFYLTNKAFSFWVFFAHQNAFDEHDFLSWQDLKSNILRVKNVLRCVTKIENLGGVEIKGHLLKAYYDIGNKFFVTFLVFLEEIIVHFLRGQIIKWHETCEHRF